jgi:selenocysteine lyase/cysteine desulfurase
MPVARLVRAVRQAHSGALVMIDGAHAPGMLAELDVPATGADWYVGNLHKWCFTLKGVALLYAGDGVRESLTQGSIISHFWRRNFSQRFFMQGTLDYSRYLGAPAACEFVRRALGGWRAMQAHNAALVEAGAQVLEARWGGLGRMLEPAAALAAEGVAVPFLAVVVTPLAWRQWAVQRDGVSSVAGLGEAEALAAALADEGLSERIARAVLAQARVQSVFYLWRVGAAHVLVCRIAAQVYNTLEDYGVLAEAVLAVHAARQAQAQQ